MSGLPGNFSCGLAVKEWVYEYVVASEWRVGMGAETLGGSGLDCVCFVSDGPLVYPGRSGAGIEFLWITGHAGA